MSFAKELLGTGINKVKKASSCSTVIRRFGPIPGSITSSNNESGLTFMNRIEVNKVTKLN